MKKILSLLCCFPVGTLWADSTVVFNEIMYHPPGGNDVLQWVELHNQMAADVDMSRWRLEEGIGYSFAEGTVLEGGGYLVIARNVPAFVAATGLTNVLGPFSGDLDHGGERVLLLNHNDRRMDQVDYRDESPWPVGPDGSGVSLAKRQPLSGSAQPGNWTVSGQIGGTPGSPNFPSASATTSNRVLVPISQSWRYDQSNQDLGTTWRQTGFDDGSWPEGQALLGLESAFVPEPIRTPLQLGRITYYFRAQFNYTGDPQSALFVLRHIVDDGIVLYLNGQEVYRWGMPEGAVGFGTLATPGVANATWVGPAQIFLPSLTPGSNLLAVELHQWSADSTDLLFGLELSEQINANGSSTNQPATLSLAFNEVAPATNALFEVELINHGDREAGLEGLVLAATSAGAVDYVFAAQSLAPGQRLALGEPQLPFHPQSGDRLFLYAPGKERLLDAAVVKNPLRGRWPEGTGHWLHPETATFGTTNLFRFHDEIVINEIMYHAPPSYGLSNAFVESSEQWAELYNRSTNTIDLTGWRLDGDIHFDFAPGTQMIPGGYLVVAADAAALRAVHPGITIVGNYLDRLSRAGSEIILKDAADNPADEVAYFDGGRWPELADGGGSSLELRDPRADNSQAEAWAASDEAARSTWRNYAYRGVAQNNPGYNVGYDLWREFVLGLLDAGEVLLDDISVIESPGGSPRQLIQNGSFESDSPQGLPATWRIVGDHGFHGRTRVQTDPDDPGNQVLHLAATGPTDVMHNHAETTLKSGSTFVSVVAGREYEIAFRAKWLAGSRLLNTRLYFNWLQKTFALEARASAGTPGLPNSRRTANLGPTWSGFQHVPTIPIPNSNVTVTVRASDPDGVASVTLRYSVNESAWQGVPMSGQTGGLYRGIIPGQSAGAVVQFYVQGADSLGASSTYPSEGPQSRALFIVNDARANLNRLHNLRMIMTAADRDTLYRATNRMSNHLLGTTVVSDESEVFYDVGVRLKGSAWGRTHDTETGLHLQFHPDHLFRGVHGSISIERGGSKREVLANHLFNRAGRGVAAGYMDVAWILTPRTSDTGVGLLATTRTTDVFFEEQFPGADEGSVYNYEVLYTPTSTVDGNVESVKLNYPYDNGTGGVPDIQDLGDDKETYRWNFQLRNNRARDDFGPILALAKAFELPGTELDARTQELMDVDQWLRCYAVESIVGNDDFYTRLWNHNVRFYERSSDHRLVMLPWDLDRSFNLATTAPLWGNANTYGNTNRFRQVIEWPANLRRFYGHIQDLADTTFRSDYTARWAAHYSNLTGEDMTGRASYLSSRITYALSQLPPPMPFIVTSVNDGHPTVTNPTFTVAGYGGIGVREIRWSGSPEPLPVVWTGFDTWQVTLPSILGTNLFALEAFDFSGQATGRQVFPVTSTASSQPQRDYLRITEIMYHPSLPPPGATNTAEDFEFVELRNIGSAPLDLTGVRFTNGITFDFTGSAVTTLAPGERVLLVANLAAFASRYDVTGLNIAGEYPDKFSNSGEQLDLVDRHGLPVHSFSYGDTWHPLTDGMGFSLVVIDEHGPLEAWSEKSGWRVSALAGGSPGAADPLPTFPRLLVNEILARPAPPGLDVIELFNASANDVDLGGWFLTDDRTEPMKYRIPEGTVILGGGFLFFDESQFNAPGLPNGFALGARGEEAYVYSGDAATNLTGYSHGFDFGASAEGVSFGRLVTSTGDEDFPPQISFTPGATNSGPRVGPVVISEIMYHPVLGGIEFVELENISPAPVPLHDPAQPLNTWRVGGLNYTLPPGVELPAQGRLILCESDPASFRAAHDVPAEVAVLGPTGGSLQNSGETLDLMRPDEVPGTVTYISVDKVRYNDRPPWSRAADGSGASLQRLSAPGYANEPANWTAALPSPGTDLPGGTTPTLTTVPADQSVQAGADVWLTVAAAGSSPLHYQWHYNGDPISEASLSTLILTNVQPEQMGDYHVVVVNAAGFAESQPARLLVVIPPTILTPPQALAVRAGQEAVFSVVAVGFGPLSYQWRFNGTDLPGANSATLTLSNVQLAQEGDYTVGIRDSVSSIESAPARLSVLVDPVILLPPLSQSVVAGGNVTFSVGIEGNPPPFGYIWRRGVVTLATLEQTGRQCFFTLTNVQPSEGGPRVTYRVIVTNAALPTLEVSASFRLTVLPDSDGDGMPDEWETAFGLDPNNATDRDLDSDDDGLTHWEEYIAGTDATNPLSCLKVDRISVEPVTVEFLALSNKTYTVQYCDDLAEGPWTTLADIPAQPADRLAQVPDPKAAPHRFYRLMTPREP